MSFNMRVDGRLSAKSAFIKHLLIRQTPTCISHISYAAINFCFGSGSLTLSYSSSQSLSKAKSYHTYSNNNLTTIDHGTSLGILFEPVPPLPSTLGISPDHIAFLTFAIFGYSDANDAPLRSGLSDIIHSESFYISMNMKWQA